MSRIRIKTPSRLHFGLIGWGPQAPRQFGGLGLMIEHPGLELAIEHASKAEIAGILATRSLILVEQISARLAEAGAPPGPVRLEVISAPPEHVGLGVGTQLSLAVATGMTLLAGRDMPDARELARLTGRGRRSGVGLHGFLHGGLIVDGGRGQHSDYPALVARACPPNDWHVLLVIPKLPPGLSGSAEVRAFDELPPPRSETADRICREIILNVLPAVAERNLDAFGRALEAIQQVMGEAFGPVQGGQFAAPELEALAATMRGLGLRGVGQSSWGPVLYGFSDAGDFEREQILVDMKSRVEGAQFMSAMWTRPSAGGATIGKS